MSIDMSGDARAFADLSTSFSGAATTATAVASSVFATSVSDMHSIFRSEGKASTGPSTAPMSVAGEGKASFWTMPGETYRYVVASDKLETVISLEARKSRQKWECRLDDAKMRECGPPSVELPRHVVVSFLLEKLKDPQAGAHRLLLQHESDKLSLSLTLVFGAMFAPTYTLSLELCASSREDLLQAQVHDLQEELDDLRKELAELRQYVKANLPPPPTPPSQQQQQQHTHSAAASKPFSFRVEAKTSTSPPVDGAGSSTLNAKAAEFVFGQPPPRPTSTTSNGSSVNGYAVGSAPLPIMYTMPEHLQPPSANEFFA